MLNDLIKTHVAPLLRQHGYRKKEMTWNKTEDTYVRVIDFQLSSYSDKKEESFTINLGVYSPAIWRVCWRKDPPNFIKEDACFPRFRVGQLFGGFSMDSTDHWWTCSEDTNLDELGIQISTVLENNCIPFVESLLSYEKINDFYSSLDTNLLPIEKVYLAIVRSFLGDSKGAMDLLSSVGSISKAWATRVEIVESQLS
ncbi:hypothetical protein GCM10008090_35040 [Arenicella chitinivorans]|uniref:DUF4304 domain-containing protein n=1 Tax=Arenicella chitinivorans TaxID=1329800 RepID=A0A918S5S3_9GAMM|nr:DUF4304 domain-containing protein [Arenicella chitinivorans]GHA22220.1 hypothetical protein GCM10008090_35040 [Arenicella chitinivorans]